MQAVTQQPTVVAMFTGGSNGDLDAFRFYAGQSAPCLTGQLPVCYMYK